MMMSPFGNNFNEFEDQGGPSNALAAVIQARIVVCEACGARCLPRPDGSLPKHWHPETGATCEHRKASL